MFARNTRGRSDYVWLRAQTLRPADPQTRDFDERRVAHQQQGLDSLLRRPLLLFFLMASIAVVLTVASMAVMVCRQVRRPSVLTAVSSCNSRMESHTSSEGLNDSQEALKRSSSSCDGNERTMNEQFCDQQLVSGGDQFANPYPGVDLVSNGPPDIIPHSFPFPASYSSDVAASTSFPLNDKNFTTSTFGT